MPVNVLSLNLNSSRDVFTAKFSSNPSYSLREAISQYVPGNCVVVDGIAYKVRGIEFRNMYNPVNTFKKISRNNECVKIDNLVPAAIPWPINERTELTLVSPTGFMPDFNEDYTRFICGDEGVLHYWLSKGAAGFRLDVADELPDQFRNNLRRSVKKFGKEKIIIGEVWEDASNKESYGVKRRYLLGDQLDSVMNYPFRRAVMDYLFERKGSADEFLQRLRDAFPENRFGVQMNLLGSHDTTRIASQKGASIDRIVAAYTLMFFLPGAPCIYYGDELGLEGGKDPDCRRTIPWQNLPKLKKARINEVLRALILLRREEPALRYGSLHFERTEHGFAAIRTYKGKNFTLELSLDGKEISLDMWHSPAPRKR